MAGTIDWERIEDAASHTTRPIYNSWSQPGRAAASSRGPDPRARAGEGGGSPPSPVDTALSGALDPGSPLAGELNPSSTPLKSHYAMLLGLPLAAATAWSCLYPERAEQLLTPSTSRTTVHSQGVRPLGSRSHAPRHGSSREESRAPAPAPAAASTQALRPSGHGDGAAPLPAAAAQGSAGSSEQRAEDAPATALGEPECEAATAGASSGRRTQAALSVPPLHQGVRGLPRPPSAARLVQGQVLTPASIFVHVAGAVRRPGVYALAGGSRGYQAVRAAGGLTAAASVDHTNLARTLRDEALLYIPSRLESAAQADDTPAPRPRLHARSEAAERLSAKRAADDGRPPLQLNLASSEELATLPGIGRALASSIVQDRAARGPFARVEDLRRVPRCGPRVIERLRPYVVCDEGRFGLEDNDSTPAGEGAGEHGQLR